MTTELRVIIVDDEAPAREGLRLRLKREENVTVLGEFADARSALEAVRLESPDVLFLDISMPGIDGFGLLDRLDDMPAAVVFVTAHDEHAVRAFAVKALDYLLKPVEQARLRETLERVREHVGRVARAEVADRMAALLREVATAGDAVPRATGSHSGGRSNRIPVRTANGVIHFVAHDEIDWIDAAGDGVTLHVGKATHRLNKSMGAVVALLDNRRFVRIHRSTVVNMDRVRELQPYFHGEYVVVLTDGTKLKLSRGQRAAVSQLLGEQR